MSDESKAPAPLVAIKVWDVPVRVFHWAIVLLLAVQVVTATVGAAMMRWHVYCGYATLVLVVFRILWGFAGSTHARFASFAAGPAATLRFARRLFSREAVPQVGHNPLGGWSVIGMLTLLLLQAVSGLFANDGVTTQGPLAVLVSAETSAGLSKLHRWNLRLLLVLAGLHVAAVLFHWLFKKEDLMGAMWTGVKRVPESVVHERRDPSRINRPRRAASREQPASPFENPGRAAVLLAAAAALVWIVIRAPN